jgi:hypothetical protein
VLSVWFYHAIADGSGNRRIQEVWSAAVRALRKEAPSVLTGQEDMRGASSIHQGVGEKGEKDGPIDETDASAARRALEGFVRSKGAGDGVNDPECIQASLLPPHPLRSSSYSVVTKLFRFPSSAITNLSTHLSSLTGTHISHFAALAAVVWADVLHARLPLMLATGNYKSSLAVVVDLRKYLPAPFSSPDYLGNLVYSTMPTWTLSQQEKEGYGGDGGRRGGTGLSCRTSPPASTTYHQQFEEAKSATCYEHLRTCSLSRIIKQTFATASRLPRPQDHGLCTRSQ